MWPFGKKAESIERSRLLENSTDWHSHLLPGVDDGFKAMEDTLRALDLMESLGVRNVWLTPHVMEDCPNETAALKSRFEELKSEYKGKINLKLASENMLDSLFEDRLESNDFLPIGDEGKHLLVETSYFNPPMNLMALLESIKSKGYYPILAHPERYQYMGESDYNELKEMGILFQANYLSILGAYGETARKKLEWMLKKGMIDVTGSDLHRFSVLDKLRSRAPKSRKMTEALKGVQMEGLEA